MTTHTDQIEEIKKAEEKAKKHIEETSEKLNGDEIKFKTKLEAETEQRKRDLLERKKQKLEIAEQEAALIINNKRAEAEGNRNGLISSAQSKQGEAVDLIITRFVEHIKT